MGGGNAHHKHSCYRVIVLHDVTKRRDGCGVTAHWRASGERSGSARLTEQAFEAVQAPGRAASLRTAQGATRVANELVPGS
jgi:hypothetical protein